VERDKVLAVIVKNLKQNVDGMEDQTIDPSKSMKEYGASSLDIVEIVSASMREIRVKVPRTELANLNNIAELADLLHTKSKQAS
jgi:polyketide biosynthesis acyl carrier protein